MSVANQPQSLSYYQLTHQSFAQRQSPSRLTMPRRILHCEVPSGSLPATIINHAFTDLICYCHFSKWQCQYVLTFGVQVQCRNLNRWIRYFSVRLFLLLQLIAVSLFPNKVDKLHTLFGQLRNILRIRFC